MNEYKSLRDHVRSYISEGIYDGTFQPGDRISEQSVADRLGVSRTPAREALMQLRSEGLLEYTPRKGFSIKMVGAKEQQDIYATVALMDAYAASMAVPSITSQDILRMKECIDKIDVAIKYRNRADYRVQQHAFHDIYRQRCGNGVVLRVLEMMETGLVSEIYEGEDTDSLFSLYTDVNDEHRHIVQLLEERDSEGLFRFLLDTHWAASRME